MDEVSLQGTLERIVFHNTTTHWTVAKLRQDNGNDLATIVGSMVGIAEGTPLSLRGQWVTDPRFGPQFRVASYQTRSPQTLVGIERYLGSGLVPGIGPELAKRVVEKFGLDTLAIINKDPKKLQQVEGIGEARATRIAQAWSEQREIQDVMVFLRGHGVSTAFAARIFKRFGKDAVNIIRENPYRLATDVWGIGFKTADGVAQSLGIDRQAPERLEAGLIHSLGICAEDGHLHVPASHLLPTTAELLSVDVDMMTTPLSRLTQSSLVMEEVLGDRGPCISLMQLWEDEYEVASAIAQLLRTPMRFHNHDPENTIDSFETQANIKLAPQQRQAIRAAVLDKCVVITGGPGVGKTTIVRAVLQIFVASGRTTALAAPTGRAAKKLGDSTGTTALTLHRLLEYQPHLGGFQRNAENPLDLDALVIDEMSMVDISLFRAVLVALRPNAQLILVGDVDQLPSVGPGAVLDDIIESGAATVVRLTEIFRQAQSSQIVVNAHAINRGSLPNLSPPKDDDAASNDFYFISRDDPILARDTIVQLVGERIPNRFGFDPCSEIQVLTPMHRGELGTVALNQALQGSLNPGGHGVMEIKRGDRVFRVGDKVMQIRNDYEKSVFNGDIGIVRGIRDEGKTIVVEFLDGRWVEYLRNDLSQLVHAFAVSVHKSQGSEYPAIVIPLVTQHYMMLQRNLLYTAITRGKQLVVLVGSKRAIAMAVQNDKSSSRWTWLAERIRQACSFDD